MAITIEQTTGGTYNGSGASPDSGNSGQINAVAGDVIMISCYTARAQATGVFDDHAVASLTAAGLTFTQIIDQAYQYEEASGAFPACSAHVDVFIAIAAGTLTNLVWTSTMAAAGDTFVNDGWCSVQIIRGLAPVPVDAAPTNPEIVTNVSLSSTTPEITADILSTESILWFLTFTHSIAGAQATATPPTGFTVPGAGVGSHFKSVSAQQSTKVDGCQSYKTYSAEQSSLVVTNGSADNCWFAAAIAFRGAGAIDANTLRGFVTVVS
jgi:hypothetical protein